MAQIGWNESNPADTESAGLGDDRIRSLTTSIRQGLDTEHVWPSAGGDAGAHRLGSSRPYYGPQSAVSSSGTDGKTMVTSDTSQFFHVGSGGTSLVGGPTVLSLGTFPGSLPQRAQWVEEIGLATVSNGTTMVAVTIPNSGFSGRPLIFLTQNEVIGTSQYGTGAWNITPTSFSITLDRAAASNVTVAWRSLGTRTL